MKNNLLIKGIFIVCCLPFLLTSFLLDKKYTKSSVIGFLTTPFLKKTNTSNNLNTYFFAEPGETCSALISTEIGGTVYEDWNYDGIMNQVDTIGVANIQVLAYDCDNIVVGTTTDADGNYKFSNLTTDGDYRIEFILPTTIASWAKPTQEGVDNGTTIQFIQSGNCANLGITAPSDYCQDNPFIVVPCFVAGDPLSDLVQLPIIPLMPLSVLIITMMPTHLPI